MTSAWWPVLANAVLLAFTYGKLVQKVADLAERVARLEKREDRRALART